LGRDSLDEFFMAWEMKRSLKPTDRNFYRMRSKEYSAALVSLETLANFQFLSFSTFYQNIKVIDDPERFIAQKINPPKNLYGAKDFMGLTAEYNYTKLNDTCSS
jgi:hypothetical protein